MNKSPSSLVAGIAHAEEITSFAKLTVERSREVEYYNTTMLNYANIIKAITETGTLGDKMDAAIALQSLDVNKAVSKNKPAFIQQANDAIANFNAALLIYDKLTTDPAWYREYAAGFMPGSKYHGLPIDEFRKALASQSSREGSRDTSIDSLPGEEALYDARKALLVSINREYQKVQGIVLSGEEPPPGSARTGGGKGKAGGDKSPQKRTKNLFGYEN